LAGRQPAESDPCIDEAFEALNKLLPTAVLSDNQVTVLIRFLSHRRQPSPAEQKSFLIHQSQPYPAVTSLFLLGTKAARPLIAVLAEPERPQFRENAVQAWTLIYRDHPKEGVRALAQAAASESDTQKANNLRDAAALVAHKCPIDMQQECETELSR